MAESYSGLESVCAVARRHGLAQSQIFTWRREARKALTTIEAPFAPVVTEPAHPAPEKPRPKRQRRRSRGGGGIELEIDGVVVRVERGAEPIDLVALHMVLSWSRKEAIVWSTAKDTLSWLFGITARAPFSAIFWRSWSES